jgi:hypothetical protein
MAAMSISSLGSNPELQQLLQSLGAANKPGATNSTSSLMATLNQNNNGPDGAAGTNPLFGGQAHKHGLSTQLESAITSALQGSGGAAGSSDANQVIQQAITSFLTSAAKSGTSGAAGSNTSSSQSAGSTDAQSVFSQLLQSNGVDADQFQQDLQSAVQSSQQSGQSIDFPSLFQNFPPGSAIDAIG